MKFMKSITSLITMTAFSLATLTSTVSHAQSAQLPPAPTPGVNEPNVGEAISPMKIGQRAPFTGLLLSPAAVAKITVELNHIDDKVKLEVDRAVMRQKAEDDLKLATVQAELTYVKNTTKIQLDNRDAQISELNKKLASNTDSILYGTGAVVVGTLLLTFLIVNVSADQ